MKALGINSWYRVFEPSLMKDATGTVSLPMKRGTGVNKLARLVGGSSAYGIFVSLLPIAMSCVPRGTLTWSDKDGQKPHDAESLSLITGFPVEVIDAALTILLDIGWLEWIEFEVGAVPPQREKLEDTLRDVGAKLMHGGANLLDEWKAATKDLGPKRVREIFAKAKPGIVFPSQFVRARQGMGL